MSDAEKMSASENLAHGIEDAVYSGGPGEPYYRPVMDCMCGFSTGRCASWADAGMAFDLHLASVQK